MSDSDDTLTVEEAAHILKVNPATVLRELHGQRLPGNTVGRAWRIRRADLREYLKGPVPVRVTEGELAFEMYLDTVGMEATFEESVTGTNRKPDYRITLDGEPGRFEVKQFDPQPEDFREGFGVRPPPYSRLREKIEAARKKFKGLKGTASCSLVLYNNGKPFVFLGPVQVYGAMLGDPTITFPFNTRTGAGDVSRMKNEFLGGGKMLRYGNDGEEAIATQNTTISAIIVVSGLDVGYRRLSIAMVLREQELGRKLTPIERMAMLEEWNERQPDWRERVARVRVYENPYAVKVLSRAFGRGPWDERFGLDADGHSLERLDAGGELAKLEQEEIAARIKVDPWAWI